MKPATIKLYTERFNEGYDMKDDELYNVWYKPKALTVSDDPANPTVTSASTVTSGISTNSMLLLLVPAMLLPLLVLHAQPALVMSLLVVLTLLVVILLALISYNALLITSYYLSHRKNFSILE